MRLRIFLSILALAAVTPADENPLLKLEGRQLVDVNPNDARLLSILARGLAYEAEKKGALDDMTKGLFSATTEAFTKQDWNRAWRLVTRLITLLTGSSVDESTDVAAAYDFTLNQRVMSYLDVVTATASPLFMLYKKLDEEYEGTFTLHDSVKNIDIAAGKFTLKTMDTMRTRITSASVPPGHHFFTFELKNKQGKVLSRAQRDFFHVPDLRLRLDDLKPKLEKARKLELADPRRKAALESVEYIHAMLTRTMKSYVADMNKTTHPLAAVMRGTRLSGYTSDMFKLPQDLEFIEALLTGLVAGKDPLEGKTGDMRMAHLSASDKSLQPFRVFIPQGYSAAKKYPLIVTLHGATGDENTYLDRYNTADGSSLAKKLAQDRGYILAAPNGRGPYGMYVDDSEKDVLEVIDRVSAIYSVNKDQVFLTGHSMGGSGAWQVGFRNASRFRGLAPVASVFGGRAQGLSSSTLKDAPEMPVLFSYGLKDTLATPETSKRLIEVASPVLKNFSFKEYPDDHFAMAVSSMSAIFDFFDRLRK